MKVYPAGSIQHNFIQSHVNKIYVWTVKWHLYFILPDKIYGLELPLQKRPGQLTPSGDFLNSYPAPPARSRFNNSIHKASKINSASHHTALANCTPFSLYISIWAHRSYSHQFCVSRRQWVFNKCFLTERCRNSAKRKRQSTCKKNSIDDYYFINMGSLILFFNSTLSRFSKCWKARSLRAEAGLALPATQLCSQGLCRLFRVQQRLFIHSCAMNLKVLKGMSEPDSRAHMCFTCRIVSIKGTLSVFKITSHTRLHRIAEQEGERKLKRAL